MTNTNIEKRLELAREARYKRLVAGGVPTTGDAIIGSLDALPDVSAQIEQVKFWAAQRLKPNDMLGYMRKEVAMFWVNGPQKK